MMPPPPPPPPPPGSLSLGDTSLLKAIEDDREYSLRDKTMSILSLQRIILGRPNVSEGGTLGRPVLAVRGELTACCQGGVAW